MTQLRWCLTAVVLLACALLAPGAVPTTHPTHTPAHTHAKGLDLDQRQQQELEQQLKHFAQHAAIHEAHVKAHHPPSSLLAGLADTRLGLDTEELHAIRSLAELKEKHDKNNDGVLCESEWPEVTRNSLFAQSMSEDTSPNVNDLLFFHQSNAAVCPLGINEVAIQWQSNEARHWSTLRFVKWLEDNMFGKYTKKAIQHGIRGKDLIRLATSNNRVMSLLGVDNPLERHRLQVRAYDTVMFGPDYNVNNWQTFFRSRSVTEIVVVLVLLLIIVVMILLLLQPRRVIIYHLPLDNVAAWTIQQVRSWLYSVGLERYGQLFADSGVDGERLLAIERKQLNELGMEDETDQNVFMSQMEALRQNSVLLPSRKSSSNLDERVMRDGIGGATYVTAQLDGELAIIPEGSHTDSGLDADKLTTAVTTFVTTLNTTEPTSPRLVRCRPEHLENTIMDFSKGVISRTTSGLLQDVPRARLRISKEVGHGTYGTVYKGFWTYWSGENESEPALVAAKFLNYKADTRAAGFDQELRILGRLNHKHIVELIAACTMDTVVLITSYCGAGSLYNFLHNDNQCYNMEWVHRIATEIASGLVYLHSQQIIHRDLKSQNILLWDRIENLDIQEGEAHPMPERLSAKICDFGLARQIDHATHMTGTPGTPAWMAPEVIRGERCNEKCDVFSYGVVLWELVTREVPWHEFEPVQIMFAVGSDSKRLPIPADVPPIYRNIIEDGLKRKIHERPSSHEIFARLEKGEEYMRQKFLEISLTISQKNWSEDIQRTLKQYLTQREKQSQLSQASSSSMQEPKTDTKTESCGHRDHPEGCGCARTSSPLNKTANTTI